jgi:hypothetical protein
MGKQKLDRLKKTLPILLVVLFVLSVTATAISAKATLAGTPVNKTNNVPSNEINTRMTGNAAPDTNVKLTGNPTNETTMTMTNNAPPGTNVTLAGNPSNKTTEIVAEGEKSAAYRTR